VAPLRLVAVPPWYADSAFVRLLAARVAEAVAGAATGAVHVFFTAHSLPARVREAGDTYPEQVEESARLVAKEAGLVESSWSMAWQSAGRTPEPWIGPDVGDEVRRLGAARGVAAVVVCPIGFVADHLEVLYDLDVEVAAVAAECGLRYARTTSLNDDPAFVAVLADAVVAADEAAA
jgi:ferrochelatase